MDEDNANQILGNVLNGEFGKRGEAYVVAQVFLTLCILFGGLPVLGNVLNILCGPVLMAIGAGVMALGIIDMGASLSPWPVPTGDDLITDGIFSKVRHPLYSGLLAIMAGFSVATGSAPRLLLTAALWYALDLKSDFEEKQLEKQYAEYKAYREQVPGKFFPQEIIAILPWTESDDSGFQ
jgi:protein-S-isoprenylcysteine O-methyltransferase Ste14